MKYYDLKQELKNGKMKHFYIFAGDERFIMQIYLKRMNAVKERSFKQLIKKLQIRSGLFQTIGVYYTEDPEIEKYSLNELLKIIGNYTVIYIPKSVDKRKDFFKKAQKEHLYYFDRLSPGQAELYVQSQLDIDNQSAGLLAKNCEYDLYRMNNEIDKLKNFGEEITPELIVELIKPPLEDQIFEMINMVAIKNKNRALKLYNDLIENKEAPIKIAVLLYNQFKSLFLVQSMKGKSNAEIAKKTNMTTWQVKNVKNLIGRFSDERLAQHLKDIQQLEIDIKTGKVNAKIGLDMLMVRLLK